MSEWFLETRPWKHEDVDNERMTWLRVFGVPCHAWCLKLFEFITSSVGKYVFSYEETMKQTNMGVARILVMTKYCLVLNQTFNVEVNENVYRIKIVEVNHGPKHIVIQSSDEDGGAWRQHELGGDENSKRLFCQR